MIEIEDKGIIIAVSEFRDSMKIVSCFTKNHGVLKGVFRVNKNLKQRESLSTGNIVHLIWNARLEEHLGRYKLEIENNLLSKIIFNKEKIYILNSIIALLKMVVNERENHEELFDYITNFISSVLVEKEFSEVIMKYCILETKLLEAAGYGLSLKKCAVKQTNENLYYISPKSGSAVSQEIGKPYHSNLFILPEIFKRPESKVCYWDIERTLNLTEHFFKKHLKEKFTYKLQEIRNRVKKLTLEKQRN